MKNITRTYNPKLKTSLSIIKMNPSDVIFRSVFTNICLLFVILNILHISVGNYLEPQVKFGFSKVYAEDKPIPWDASPRNWKNSPYNYDNSELNFKNSQSNYLNQKSNVNRINIVNLLGIVTGYVVKKTDGGWNYFDNDGKRIGYSPDNGKTAYTVTGESTTFSLENKK